MATTEQNINILFDTLTSTIKKFGVYGAIDALKEYSPLQKENNERDFKTLNYLIDVVCGVYGLPREDIMIGTKRGVRKEAMVTLAFVSYDLLKIKPSFASRFVNKHPTAFSHYRKEALNYDPNHPIDKIKLKKLDEVVSKFKDLKENFHG